LKQFSETIVGVAPQNCGLWYEVDDLFAYIKKETNL
jgi:hypothetical protein